MENSGQQRSGFKQKMSGLAFALTAVYGCEQEESK